jgi:hypothetical protein
LFFPKIGLTAALWIMISDDGDPSGLFFSIVLCEVGGANKTLCHFCGRENNWSESIIVVFKMVAS